MEIRCCKHSRAVPRGNIHARDPPHSSLLPETSSLCTFHLYSKTEAHAGASSLEGGGAVYPSPAHSCQASTAQSGAWIRAPLSPQFSQCVIVTGALVLNNYVVPHCENEGHNGPLLNLWCDDLLAQQLIKCYGNGVSKLFIAAFVCLRVYLVFCCFSVQCW